MTWSVEIELVALLGAAKTLPTLQEHLTLAQEAHNAVSSSMRSSATVDKPAPTTGGTQGLDATQPRQ